MSCSLDGASRVAVPDNETDKPPPFLQSGARATEPELIAGFLKHNHCLSVYVIAATNYAI